MRANAFWAASRALPLAPLQAITGGRALILAPHPDDESLGCGGLIAEACAQGEPPIVVVLTDGSMSHPNSASYPAPLLRAVREAEMLAAARCLGLAPDRVVFLRVPDTQAPTDGPDFGSLASRIAALAAAHGCRTMLTTWAHDPHCDHAAAAAIARRAATLAGIPCRFYPVWGLTLAPQTELPLSPAGYRLDIRRHLPTKTRAIFSHASQYAGLIDDDPDAFQLAPGFIALFQRDTELFLVDPA